jgi:hypothetical protein
VVNGARANLRLKKSIDTLIKSLSELSEVNKWDSSQAKEPVQNSFVSMESISSKGASGLREFCLFY